jgi:hypothetical protein
VKGGHVISAAILDFRIFAQKSEEKKDIKKFVSKLLFKFDILEQPGKIRGVSWYWIWCDVFLNFLKFVAKTFKIMV